MVQKRLKLSTALVVLPYSAVLLLSSAQITGIASTADYLDYLPSATEYRKHSPGWVKGSHPPVNFMHAAACH